MLNTLTDKQHMLRSSSDGACGSGGDVEKCEFSTEQLPGSVMELDHRYELSV